MRPARRRAAHRNRLNNLTLFAGCVAIWSTTWLAITYQLGPVAPELSVAWRFLLAALIVAAWCRLRGLPLRFRPGEHAALALLGVTMYSIGYIFVYHAERFLVSGLVAVGYSASPLLAMLGMRLIFGQPVSARMALGSVLGIAGITLVFWPEFGRLAHNRDLPLGALLTALAVVFSSIGGRRPPPHPPRQRHRCGAPAPGKGARELGQHGFPTRPERVQEDRTRGLHATSPGRKPGERGAWRGRGPWCRPRRKSP